MNDRMIGPAFGLTFLCAIGLIAVYVAGGQTQLEGLLLFGAFGGFGVGLILWAKHLLPDVEEIIQVRHTIPSTDDEQLQFEGLLDGTVKDFTRRKFLVRLGLGAAGALGLAALFPLKSLGANPGDVLFHTKWRPNLRLVTENGAPIRVTDMQNGAIQTVWPDGEERHETSAVLLIKAPVDVLQARPGREQWAPQGNIAYSKICSHLGCPVGLYQERTGTLLCPCHQSMFDVFDGARPTFGPASRSLPQLPLAVDEQGYLIAQSDFHEPVGGSFWERERRERRDA